MHAAMRPAGYRDPLDLALAEHRRGDLARAGESYKRILAGQPRNPGALMGLGLIAYQNGDYDTALSLLEKARHSAPHEPAVLNNLGLVLAASGRADEAARAWRTALAIQPRFADALVNLAAADARAGRPQEAISGFRAAIAANPHCVPALGNLGTMLVEQRSYGEALHFLRRAAALDPMSADIMVNIGRALSECGLAREARAAFEVAVRLRPDDRVAASNRLLTLHYCDDVDTRTVIDAHTAWGRTWEPEGGVAPRPQPVVGRSKWRIGLLSGDFNDHAVMRFLTPFLEHRDRERAELYCYYTGSRHDFCTELVQRETQAFAFVGGLSDEEIAREMRKDGIDVLIDLSGHSAGGRPSVLALRPAPLQVSWLGYLCTTGLASVDFRITDEIADPQGSETEGTIDRPWRLPAMWSYQPRPDTPQVSPSPAASRGAITFGSTNNPAKLSDSALSLWAGVLRSVPASRLAMFAHDDPLCRDRIVREFRASGISPDRLHFFGRERAADYLARYGTIDILLDSTPYSGGTTTCDALWMGVPVVTLAGDRPFSRTSASILHAAGLSQWIAGDRHAYITIAGNLADDIPALSNIRMQLRGILSRSRLLDGAAMSRQLLEGLGAMWAAVGLPART